MKQFIATTSLALFFAFTGCTTFTPQQQYYDPVSPTNDSYSEVCIYIKKVKMGSLAQMNGLTSGLKVTAIDGHRLTTIQTLQAHQFKEKSLTITVAQDDTEVDYFLTRETAEEHWGLFFSVKDSEGTPISFQITKKLDDGQPIQYVVKDGYRLSATLKKLKERLIVLNLSLLNKSDEPIYFDITALEFFNNNGEKLRPIVAEEAALTFLDKTFEPENTILWQEHSHKVNTTKVSLSPEKQGVLMKEPVYQGYVTTYGVNYVDVLSPEYREFIEQFNESFIKMILEKMKVLEPQASEKFRDASLRPRTLGTGENIKGAIYFYEDSQYTQDTLYSVKAKVFSGTEELAFTHKVE